MHTDFIAKVAAASAVRSFLTKLAKYEPSLGVRQSDYAFGLRQKHLGTATPKTDKWMRAERLGIERQTRKAADKALKAPTKATPVASGGVRGTGAFPRPTLLPRSGK